MINKTLMETVYRKVMQPPEVPDAEEIFEHRSPFELSKFFHERQCNYYIVLYDSSVISSFEFPMPGVMRVYCEKMGYPYLSIYHKTKEDLIKDQT